MTMLFGYFVKLPENGITMYSKGNLVSLCGVLYKHKCWVFGWVNWVYFTKDIKPYPLGPLGVHRRVNYKSNLNGPGGPMLGILFQNPQ